MKLPLQPLEKDDQGVIRFVPNRIVRYLLDSGKIDMNDLSRLAGMGLFTKEEQTQFASLIGYSLSGFSELSYVSDAAYDAAEKSAEAIRKKRKKK